MSRPPHTAIPSSWPELCRFILPQSPVPGPDKLTFSTATARYEGLDSVPQNIEFSILDTTLVDRLSAFLETFLSRARCVLPLDDHLQASIADAALEFSSQELSSEDDVTGTFLMSLYPTIKKLVSQVLSLREVQRVRLNRQSPSLTHRQRGDANLIVVEPNKNRVAVEFKGPAVLIAKREELESEELLDARKRSENAKAMKTKLGLQMSPNDKTWQEKTPARFGFFFGGYTAVIVERVNSQDGRYGLLVSPQFRVCDSQIPYLHTTKDITANYDPILNPIPPRPLLALMISTLLDGLLPGEHVPPPPPFNPTLPRLPNVPELPEDDEDEDEDDGNDKSEDENEDEDDKKADPDWPIRATRQPPSGPGARGRQTSYGGKQATMNILVVEPPGFVLGRFSVSPLSIFPSPTLSSCSTFSSSARSPFFSSNPDASSPFTSPSSSVLLSSSWECSHQPPSLASSEGDLSSTPKTSPPLSFPIILNTLIHGNERGRTWRGTWAALQDENEEATVVVKFCFDHAYFQREISVYQALAQLSYDSHQTQRQIDSSNESSSPSPAPLIAPKLYAAFEDEEKSWTALVLEDVGETLERCYLSLGDVYKDKPKLFAQIRRNLRQLHKLGFVHGDLEPRNIAQDGRLFDFGHSSPHDCHSRVCDELLDFKNAKGGY